MKVVLKIIILVLALSLWAGVASAATDFQLWMEGGLRYRINRKLQLRFDQYLRLDDNASHVRRVMPQIALRYRVARWFRVTGGFRFIIDPREDSRGKYANLWYRFYADALFRYRKRPVVLSYRIRFQEQFGWERDSSGVTLRNTIRQRGKIALRLGKGFEPYISGEFYIRINDPNGVWHKWRATLGLDYAYKVHDFGIYWRGEGKLDNTNDPTLNILGLSYHYNF